MPTPGYYFRDGGTTPLEESQNPLLRQSNTRPVTATSKAPLGQETTTSHILATQTKVGGAAQEAGKIPGVTNLGWQNNTKGVDQLVAGLDNDDLWMLVRRFNKACGMDSHVDAKD